MLRCAAPQRLEYLVRRSCAPFGGVSVGRVCGNGAISGVAVVVLDD